MAQLTKVKLAGLSLAVISHLGWFTAGCSDDPGPCQSVCGDRATTCLEECDDGNRLDGDGCSAACRLEVCPDADGDGHQALVCGGDDCDDDEAGVHPGAVEVLGDSSCQDGLDNDCDGYTDSMDLACFPCREHADCDDGDGCNGEERCQGNHCEAGQPLACDDGLFCNGQEICDQDEGLSPGPAALRGGERVLALPGGHG